MIKSNSLLKPITSRVGVGTSKTESNLPVKKSTRVGVSNLGPVASAKSPVAGSGPAKLIPGSRPSRLEMTPGKSSNESSVHTAKSASPIQTQKLDINVKFSGREQDIKTQQKSVDLAPRTETFTASKSQNVDSNFKTNDRLLKTEVAEIRADRSSAKQLMSFEDIVGRCRSPKSGPRPEDRKMISFSGFGDFLKRVDRKMKQGSRISRSMISNFEAYLRLFQEQVSDREKAECEGTKQALAVVQNFVKAILQLSDLRLSPISFDKVLYENLFVVFHLMENHLFNQS